VDKNAGKNAGRDGRRTVDVRRAWWGGDAYGTGRA